MKFAEAEFHLRKSVEGGGTHRDHYQVVEQKTKKRIDILHVKCPAELQYVWDMYLDIRLNEPHVNLSVIRDYCELAGVSLNKSELDLIRVTETLRLLELEKK